MIPKGRLFYKMSGSGNDFVVVDARNEPTGDLDGPERIRSICARGTGIGADGIVFLQPSTVAALRLVYLNADGSRAELCGNATLCTARLVVELGAGDPAGFMIETDAGVLHARILANGLPEFDLDVVSTVQPDAAGIAPAVGERRIGFALAGVPHLAVLRDEVDSADVVGRGRHLRHHPGAGRTGANVNFVARTSSDDWSIRSYERGVEGETLACGTGAVATAILLSTWGLAGPDVRLVTRSQKKLCVRLIKSGDNWRPSLSGEARIVFTGQMGEM
jgi:diaminopimelate epimerase